jgi:hypothetical protein
MNHPGKILQIHIRVEVYILGLKMDVAITADREIVKETDVNF